MQDKFENNMSKKLEELSFIPSENVWNNIEGELKKDKRPRIAAWWWMLPLVILLGWGIYSLLLSEQSHQQKPKAAESSPVVNGSGRNTTRFISPAANPIPQKQSAPVSPTAAQALIDTPSQNMPANKISAGKSKNRIILSNLSSGKKSKFTDPSNKKPQALTNNAVSSISVSAAALSDEPETKETAPAPETTKQITEIDRPDKLSPVAKTTEGKKEKKDSFSINRKLKKASPNNSSSKWQIGLLANAGIASINKVGSFGENEPSSFYAIANDPGTVTPGRIVSNSYKINNGASFSGGFVLSKALSQKFRIGSGALYNYTRVGIIRTQKTDSIFATTTGVISNTTRRSIYNENLQLHAFDVPVSAGFTLLTSKKIGLNLNAIILNRFLISENWENYEVVLGKKKTYMPSFQLNPVVTFTKWQQLSIGPYVSFGLSKIQDNKRLMNAGLSLQYLIKK